MKPLTCDWCGEKLTRKEYQNNLEKKFLCVCDKCDKYLDELIRGLELGKR